MNRLSTEFIIGLFMLLGLLCLTFLAFRMGELTLFDRSMTVVARFVSVSGLKEGAIVELAGVTIGTVKSIEMDPTNYQAKVELAIDPGVAIHEDAIASIRTQGIIGDKFVKITPGGSPNFLGPGQEILDTEPSISLEELISKYIFEK
jgi:phospholipid/cholesterol/gamma-HCH transport system substrate-binding protein